ncbi:MAG TPA: hypothetical protein VM737_08130 [Gemmatimonadota bacterium]|nr:hypothetical protein [Gemmatimonadota bacterium]
MTALFHAHSGLRYLVLLAGAVALAWFLYGWLRGTPFARPAPVFLATLIGLVDLQVVLGLVLYLGGRTAPGIIGHLALMLGAAVVLHLASLLRRRQAGGFGLPLAGTALAMALIVLGILAIGRAVL